MFDTLSDRLQTTFRRLRGKGRLAEGDVSEALREVRRALLEADVNHAVAREFVERVRQRAIGQEILQSLSAAQQVVKIVNDELVALMGGEQARLARAAQPPTVVMLVGLQGAGKTTAIAKLARLLHTAEHRRPLLVAADIYRPAAVTQLQLLGRQIDVPVFSKGDALPQDIVRQALAEARRAGHDYVLVDTAGRLQIDGEMMDELIDLKRLAAPQEILLVLDAMTGQEAVAVAQEFHRALGVTGVILSKMDSDTRGGAALTVRHITGCPIKYVGTGERPDAPTGGLEPFHPDRMASRILGMGDVLTLIEKAQATIDERQARELEEKIRHNDFTFDDFLAQLRQVKNLGPLDQLLGMLPGMGRMKQMKESVTAAPDGQLKKVEAIILSMSREERGRPELIEKSASRRLRIAKGSGTQVKDVNQLLRQFSEMRKLMKQFSGLGKGGRRGAGALGQLGAGLPGAPRDFAPRGRPRGKRRK